MKKLKLTKISLGIQFLILFVFASAVPNIALAQYSPASNAPDCYFTSILSTATRSSIYDNRETKCSVWTVQVVNLSDAGVAYSLDRSGNGTSDWKIIGALTGLAANTAGNLTATNGDNFFSINLTSSGSGDVIFAVSGYAYNKGNRANKAIAANVPITIIHDPASATISYYCEAKSIFDPATNTNYAICAIYRITYNATPEFTLKQWADGDASETKVWANRAGLSYK